MASLRDGLFMLAYAHKPLTVRQLFYRAVVTNLVPKTQQQYKSTVVRLVGEMREAGELPWEWIIDETRWMRKPTSYCSLADALNEAHRFYRRDVWAAQPHYLEVWAESDSCAGIVYPITAEWDVPLMAARGFASKTFCKSTAETIEANGKPAIILYVGDRDPSGVHIDRDIEAKIRRYAPGIDLEFRRIAVTEEQVSEMNLPSSPPKKGDSRSKGFDGQAVEVEAIEPSVLRQIVEDAITDLIDSDSLERLRSVEAAERRTLASVIESMGGAA